MFKLWILNCLILRLFFQCTNYNINKIVCTSELYTATGCIFFRSSEWKSDVSVKGQFYQMKPSNDGSGRKWTQSKPSNDGSGRKWTQSSNENLNYPGTGPNKIFEFILYIQSSVLGNMVAVVFFLSR
jgi:hypothetical protein